MIEKLRCAERELNRTCRVLMDVPGPKLRTGPTEVVPGVIKWRPRRDRFGAVTEPAKIWLTPLECPETCPESNEPRLTVPAAWLNRIGEKDMIKFFDARGRSRSMKVTKAVGHSRIAESSQTCYVTSETVLELVADREGNGSRAQVGEAPPFAQPIILKRGDTFILVKGLERGTPAVRAEGGDVLGTARISVTWPEIFSDIRPGQASGLTTEKSAA